ncbi:MAG: hypothetical protein E7046_00260 [Lentisphaerae bacterium]|nr:hypothetical protein [Lentisphaerota bacterium]
MNKKMLKNSKAGRIICRLFGEETGATMMEYVILAVMIAAAVTAAAIYFGNAAKNQMNVAGDAMVGNTATAEQRAKSAQDIHDKEATAAHTSANKFKKMTTEASEAKGGK